MEARLNNGATFCSYILSPCDFPLCGLIYTSKRFGLEAANMKDREEIICPLATLEVAELQILKSLFLLKKRNLKLSPFQLRISQSLLKDFQRERRPIIEFPYWGFLILKTFLPAFKCCLSSLVCRENRPLLRIVFSMMSIAGECIVFLHIFQLNTPQQV